jgi:xanthine dehydrogenase accessory factor
MIAWLDTLRRIAPCEPLAMVSVLATEGSAPRGAGTRMLVTRQHEYGTIGGGKLEFQAARQARAILDEPAGSWRIQDYPLGPLLGQCCGGRVRLLVEHIDPARLGWLDDAGHGGVLVTRLEQDAPVRNIVEAAPVAALSARGDKPGIGATLAEPWSLYRRPLYLFGAGHVGQAIAHHAARLPLRLAWFDTRPRFAELEGVTLVDEETITACVQDAPDDAGIVILTHDHGLDYRLTAAALRRSPLAFVGLIGSDTKRARFHGRLLRDGILHEALARLVCPIGVPGIEGKEPDVIAIAVLAQLLQLEPTPNTSTRHAELVSPAVTDVPASIAPRAPQFVGHHGC